MIRVTALWILIFALSVYAWRDWYRSLCGLIVLMAVIEHPDIPNSIFGIQGLNPWNVLLVMVSLAWLVQRRREGLTWDLPRSVSVLLLLYLGVVLVGFFRMMSDRSGLEMYTTADLVSENLINTVKWVIPGLLLFDGSRSRPRLLLGLASLLAIYILLAVQVIRWMPPSEIFSGETLSQRSGKILLNEIGYHRVNMSMMLAGASWALLATTLLAKRYVRLALVVASGVVLYAQSLTGGRMGYVTWAVVGLVLCAIRWRRYLPLVPVVILAVAVIAPFAAERMLQGFAAGTRDTNALATPRETENVLAADDGPDGPDAYTITAGRNVAWSYVMDKIGESPLIGFGRLAMQRTGLTRRLWDDFQETFPHPHNAYLELLLDSGAVGLLVVVPFYVLLLAHGIVLFRDRSPLSAAIGGVACALILALLIASFGSQTFYPREGSVGMWCAIGLMLRTAASRRRASETAPVETPASWWQPVRFESEGAHHALPAQQAPVDARPWWRVS